MEGLNVSTAAIVAHVLITCIPWLVGVVAGGGLGVLCALGIRATFSARPGLRSPSVLLPWRSVVMALLMVALSPFIAVHLGLGPLAGGIMVGSSVTILALAFTCATLVDHWHRSPLGARLVAGARTLAVAAGLIAVEVGVFGGGGVGGVVLDGIRLQQADLMWSGLLVVFLLVLVLDVLLGAVQVAAHRLRGAAESGGPAMWREVAA
jgi:ABC-type nitrate/sulfonate/bicarbonate transport system permease component